jgi:hypothetical protein
MISTKMNSSRLSASDSIINMNISPLERQGECSAMNQEERTSVTNLSLLAKFEGIETHVGILGGDK